MLARHGEQLPTGPGNRSRRPGPALRGPPWARAARGLAGRLRLHGLSHTEDPSGPALPAGTAPSAGTAWLRDLGVPSEPPQRLGLAPPRHRDTVPLGTPPLGLGLAPPPGRLRPRLHRQGAQAAAEKARASPSGPPKFTKGGANRGQEGPQLLSPPQGSRQAPSLSPVLLWQPISRCNYYPSEQMGLHFALLTHVQDIL